MKLPNDMKIDAVITWVDGDDPRHKAKREQYGDRRIFAQDDVAGSTRYKSLGEIFYCIASLNRFAPWLNKIYIVTDEQNPMVEEFLRKHFPEGTIPMEIVDHKVIFRGYDPRLCEIDGKYYLSWVNLTPHGTTIGIAYTEGLVKLDERIIDRYWSPVHILQNRPAPTVDATIDTVRRTKRRKNAVIFASIPLPAITPPKHIAHTINHTVCNIPAIPSVATNSFRASLPVSIAVDP